MRLIESDAFPFEFLSQLAERESWRKEVHRPICHVHKWWAKRLGSVFRGILLGAKLPEDHDLAKEFSQTQQFANVTVFDPFMGSGWLLSPPFPCLFCRGGYSSDKVGYANLTIRAKVYNF